MKLHPFYECAERAEELIQKGHAVYQQWSCHACGAKQTMPDRDAFYKLGICEECRAVTNIEKDGCNYMLVTACGGELPKD